ncbi:hypothetical protein AVEN_205270-1 [Araneus ventricosus]|uniref:Uncharacterized protein n=1 Tax=Araneus ventricosus TaxID=182803 RepID=A0A4Y2EI07_ARAVE|nr:hypothetical protein AVEN_205270-1 [Araneus ventricosus]
MRSQWADGAALREQQTWKSQEAFTPPIRENLNDRPPRRHRAQWSPYNSPHYERLMRSSPVLPRYYPSSKMGPKSHTTITIPISVASSFLLIRRQLIRENAVGSANLVKETTD